MMQSPHSLMGYTPTPWTMYLDPRTRKLKYPLASAQCMLPPASSYNLQSKVIGTQLMHQIKASYVQGSEQLDLI